MGFVKLKLPKFSGCPNHPGNKGGPTCPICWTFIYSIPEWQRDLDIIARRCEEHGENIYRAHWRKAWDEGTIKPTKKFDDHLVWIRRRLDGKMEWFMTIGEYKFADRCAYNDKAHALNGAQQAYEAHVQS